MSNPTSRGRSAAEPRMSPRSNGARVSGRIRGSARSSLRPRLDLDVSAAAGKRFVPYVRRHLRNAHRILRPALRELSLAFVGDTRMSALHEQFMGVAGPTDVLTFPLETDARGRVLSGEVVVCVPEAVRRARETGGNVERELLLYALHGLLHLCGYDDRTEPGFRRMHGTEDMILTQLGVGPVFHPHPSSTPDGARRRRKRKPRRDAARRAPAKGSRR